MRIVERQIEIEQSRTQEIVSLHQEIVGHLRQSLEKAIRIGELLTEQKGSLKHGEFTPWLETNIPFTDRTARNYMRLYRERDRIKTESVSDLNDAYRLITSQKELPAPPDYDDEFLNSVCPFRCYMGTVLLDPDTSNDVTNSPENSVKAWRLWVNCMMKLDEKLGHPKGTPCKYQKPFGHGINAFTG
jgi:hypothetical protein